MSKLSWIVSGASMIPCNQLSETAGVVVSDQIGTKELLDELLNTEWNRRTIVRGQLYHLVGIHGSEFEPKARSNGNVLALGRNRGYEIPPPEIVVMMAAQLTKGDLPFGQYVIMHEPKLAVSNNLVRFLITVGNEKLCIGLCSLFDSDVWEVENDVVFVFLAPNEEVA